jgi:hypothetical protein
MHNGGGEFGFILPVAAIHPAPKAMSGKQAGRNGATRILHFAERIRSAVRNSEQNSMNSVD